ncbi:FAD-dependent monooxygenase [Mycobacterium sp. WMMD1722]|uniref:FAD-dependent monooxygenase n=1 Tax=Mycobacterium sp. WMMD1722 TaxID=3404117 RepID=UPI003BF4FA43
MTSPSVLITGASLAGPAAAFWFARAGFDVVVIEQSRELRDGGNGVDIRGEALPIVDRMGLTAAVRERALDTQGMRFVDRRDRERARIATAGLDAMVGSEDIEVTRGDLSRLLYDATRHDVDYQFGEAITSLAQDDAGVDVTLRGGSTRRFDLVVGADGIHSGVRRHVFGPEQDFRVFKHHYYAVASADLAIGEQHWTTFYNEPGRAAYVFRAEPGRGLINFLFRTKHPLSYDYRDIAAQRLLLRQAFTGLDWYVPQMLAAAEAAPDFYFDSLDQVHMPSWSRGRVALVGDAAYCASPASGAGALLALTGAYRLAGEVAAGGSIAAALTRYEEAQRPLVAQKQSQLFTNISVPRTRAGIMARNMLLSSPLTARLSGHRTDTARPVHEYTFAQQPPVELS